MNLAQTILENERTQNHKRNSELIAKRLKDLVFQYSDETVQLLHKTGVAVSSVLPPAVLHAVVVNNLASNSELREAIAKVILDQQENYLSVDGGGTWQLIGGALGAVGSVLSGLGRSKSENDTSDSKEELALAQQQKELAEAKAKRTTILVIGISSIVVFGLVIAFIAYAKSKAKVASPAKIGTSPQLATQ